MGQIVPIVANIHYDDILNKFALKITAELETPAGNKRLEERFTLADLASVFNEILQIWAIAAGHGPGITKPFIMGDIAGLTDLLGAGQFLTTEYPELPTAYEDTSEWERGDWTPPDDWGITV